MKFTCLKENIERAVIMAERFAGKNMALPILGSVLFETHANQLRVIATNLEYAVQIMVPGKIIKEGKVSVPSKTISQLIQSIKDEKVDIEEKQNNLILKTNSRDVKINGISPEEFPILPEIKKIASFSVDVETLKLGLYKVLPAVSITDFKPEFTGVFFNVSQNELKIVATDTFRLAEQKMSISYKKEGEKKSFILPHQIAQEVSRIDSMDREIVISLGENQILFETGGIKIISRIIEGNFPDYVSIIPKTFDVSVSVNKNCLKDSVKASSIFSSKLMDVSLSFMESGMEITSSNQEIGEYRNNIPAQIANNKKNTKVGFNYKYLMDGLGSLDEDEIFIGCNSENSPSLFHNKSNKDFLYVLMPIKSS